METTGRAASAFTGLSTAGVIERHCSRGRTIVTATVASAMPYAGQNASDGNPTGAKASVNRSSVSACTNSDPTMTVRKRDRSSAPMRALVRTARSNAKFGAPVYVAPDSEQVRSHDRGLATNVSGFISASRWQPNRVEAAASGVSRNPMRPMSCDNGSHEQLASPGSDSSVAAIVATCVPTASSVRWMPFGVPTLPDVNCTNAPSPPNEAIGPPDRVSSNVCTGIGASSTSGACSGSSMSVAAPAAAQNRASWAP